MGLLSTTHLHRHETVNNITRSPERIDIHEHKAVTDESVRYMEDAHNKAMENIIAKVKVEDNLIKGDIFLISQPWNIHDVKVICKFKINGQEHIVEKEVDRGRFMFGDDHEALSALSRQLEDGGKAIMLWYALKHFSADAYKKMTGREFDFDFLANKP